VRNRLGKLLVTLFLIVSIGGHWALLQSFAWVTMVIDYSKEAPISVAVAKTFDGAHPCGLCKMVSKGKASEKKQDAIKVKTKVDFWIASTETTLPPTASCDMQFAAPAIAVFADAETPPVPPPRRA
jgi:hypothetical protein